MKENNIKTSYETLVENCKKNRENYNGGIMIKSMVFSDLCDYIEYNIQEDFDEETIKMLAECGEDILTLLYDTFMGNKGLNCNSRHDIIKIIRIFLRKQKRKEQ